MLLDNDETDYFNKNMLMYKIYIFIIFFCGQI